MFTHYLLRLMVHKPPQITDSDQLVELLYWAHSTALLGFYIGVHGWQPQDHHVDFLIEKTQISYDQHLRCNSLQRLLSF